MKKPTIKQAKAIKNVVENGGNVSKAMRDANYAPATIKNPSKLTESKTWKNLMEKDLPDDLLTKKHKQLLKKREILLKNNNKTGKVEAIKGGIDTNAVKAGLDMAYKLKGRYIPEKVFEASSIGKIIINKKVLNIINEAENKTKQVIEAEIQDD